MPELKPCPFCGEEAEIIEFSDRFQCGCKDEGCIAWAEDMPVYLTRSGAIKEWNTRAYEEKNDADVMENPTMYVLMVSWHRVIVPALIPATIEACAYKSNVVFDVLPAGVSSSKEKLEKRAKELKERFSSTFHSYEIVLVQEF